MSKEEKMIVDLGVKLANLRMDRNMTQADISKRSCVHPGTICNIENGHTRNPGIITLYYMAKAMGLGLKDILPREML